MNIAIPPPIVPSGFVPCRERREALRSCFDGEDWAGRTIRTTRAVAPVERRTTVEVATNKRFGIPGLDRSVASDVLRRLGSTPSLEDQGQVSRCVGGAREDGERSLRLVFWAWSRISDHVS